jgi:hypothetical protein
MPSPLAQSMNHIHNRTTIEGLTPTFGMPQQTMSSMFRQGYTHTTPSFSMLQFTLATYTPTGNGRAYVHTSGNYQAPYTTVAYTDPIPLSDSSLGFLPNHAYQNPPRFNAYSQPEADGFGYEIPLQFPFRSQLIDATPSRGTVELGVDLNNLTNQLATILHESFGIEHQSLYSFYFTPVLNLVDRQRD